VRNVPEILIDLGSLTLKSEDPEDRQTRGSHFFGHNRT